MLWRNRLTACYELLFSDDFKQGARESRRCATSARLEVFVFLLTQKGSELGALLRARDYSVAEVKGHTGDGELTIIRVEIARREAQKLIHIASVVDEHCAVIVHDIRRLDLARHAYRKAISAKTSAEFRWLSRLRNSFQ